MLNLGVPAKSVEGFDEHDKALILDVGNMHYGVLAQFDKPIVFGLLTDPSKAADLDSLNLYKDISHKDLVLQYEVRLEEQHICGGAYLKLLRPESSPYSELTSSIDNDTPYSVMFGPDKCGSTNKVHFIVQIQNPLTKIWVEHHYRDILSMANDKRTHLYAIHIKKNGDFDIYLDNIKV